jgi:hypothetical protein
VPAKSVMPCVTDHLLASKTIIIVATEFLFFLWSIIYFFTSASRSCHFAICLRKECLFFSNCCYFSSSFLHSHIIFSVGGGPKCLLAALLPCSLHTLSQLIRGINLFSINWLPLWATKQVVYTTVTLCFSPSTHKSRDNHHYPSSELRNINCFGSHIDACLDHKMQGNFIQYFPGKNFILRSAKYSIYFLYIIYFKIDRTDIMNELYLKW